VSNYLYLFDPDTAIAAGALYLMAMFTAGPGIYRYLVNYRRPARKRRTAPRHVASRTYVPRWSTSSVPRHKALTDAAPARYLSTGPIPTIVEMPVRTPAPTPATNALFVAEIMREHIR
jgi:hypothetical protein